jgi:hypothetical protein
MKRLSHHYFQDHELLVRCQNQGDGLVIDFPATNPAFSLARSYSMAFSTVASLEYPSYSEHNIVFGQHTQCKERETRGCELSNRNNQAHNPSPP